MVYKKSIAMATAPDCCFGRGSFSSRLGKKGIMSSCETAGDLVEWAGRARGLVAPHWAFALRCLLRDVGYTSRKNSLSGDSDDPHYDLDIKLRQFNHRRLSVFPFQVFH